MIGPDSVPAASQDCDGFENVTLEGESVTLRDPDVDPPYKKKGKIPKKILHFSDGTLEVYSSSSDDDDAPEDEDEGSAMSKLLKHVRKDDEKDIKNVNGIT